MAAAARMKNAQTANIAVIGDEDTVTGFLLAGVGAMDGKKDTTYLMVDSSEKQ
jgi:vacuolar-type H+-ATPase subunit F/Vma7